MKKLIGLTLASLVSLVTAFAQADDHSTGPLFYGQSIGVVASDAPAVLAAMDKWRNSKTMDTFFLSGIITITNRSIWR